MMPWKLVADPNGYIFLWLVAYSALLGPIGGILIADYFVYRKRQLDVDALYDEAGEYRYTRGVSVVEPLYARVIVGLVPPGVSKLPLPSRSQT